MEADIAEAMLATAHGDARSRVNRRPLHDPALDDCQDERLAYARPVLPPYVVVAAPRLVYHVRGAPPSSLDLAPLALQRFAGASRGPQNVQGARPGP